MTYPHTPTAGQLVHAIMECDRKLEDKNQRMRRVLCETNRYFILYIHNDRVRGRGGGGPVVCVDAYVQRQKRTD